MPYDVKLECEESNVCIRFSEEQLICTICSSTWLNKKPRCLPCEVSHIFCSDCLEQFAAKNRLKAGEKFGCPNCRKQYIWPKNGVKSFVLLMPFVGTTDCHSSIDMEIGDNDTQPFSILSEDEKFREEESKDFESEIMSALESLSEERINESKCLQREAKNLASMIFKKQSALQDELDVYFAEKESNLRFLLKNVKTYQLFLNKAGEMFEHNVLEMRNKLLKEMNKVFQTSIKFKSHVSIEDFELGESICEEFEPNFIQTEIDIDGTIHNISCLDKRLYVLTKDRRDKRKIEFKIFRIENEAEEFLFHLETNIDSHFKMIIKDHVYMLETGGDSNTFLKLEINPSRGLYHQSRYQLTEVDFFTKQFNHNPWSHICSSYKVLILFNDYVMEVYSFEPKMFNYDKLKVLELPSSSGLRDVRSTGNYIFMLFNNGSIYTADIKDYDEFSKLKVSERASCISFYSNVIEPLKNGCILLSNSKRVYIANLATKCAVSYPLLSIVKDCKMVDYEFIDNDILFYFVIGADMIIKKRYIL